MAGRPKRRAAEAARVAALQAATLVQPSTLQPNKRQIPLPPEGYIPPAPRITMPAPSRAEQMKQIQADDRKSLAEWWRDHTELMFEEYTKRAEILRTAGEHPSAQVAKEAYRCGVLGMPKELAAKCLSMSEGELDQHYGAEFEAGGAEILSQVAANFLRIASSQNDRVSVKAAIEFLERRGGEDWRKPAQKIEISDDRTKKPKAIDLGRLSFEQRAQLREIMQQQLDERTIDMTPRGSGLVPTGLIESEDVEDVE
jgi:hypothetical protein